MTFWYLRSTGDHDTHRGHLRRGRVLAVCGMEFAPLRAGIACPALAAEPPDPELVCPECYSTTLAR